MKIIKQCCIRLEPDLHRRAKLKAYEEGMTLQEWLAMLILERLKQKK